jgi:type IV pilus assembly protein PilQ
MNTPSRLRMIGTGAGAVLLALAALPAGCTTPEGSMAVHKEPRLADWTRAPESSVSAAPERPGLPPALTEEPMSMPPPPRAAPERELPTLRIGDLELAGDADVATVLRAMAKAANVNLLISPEVEGRVSFAFQDVPWDQAFRSVIISAGLAYAWEGEILRVMTLEDMKRSLDMETVLKQREDVKAEKRRVEPMLIQVIPIRYSKARSVGATVRSLMAAPEKPGTAADSAQRTSVSVDEENNAIIVHAIREEVAKALALVEQLDRAKAQVHIEARIVEATRDTARQLGVQWGLQSAQMQGGRLITTGGRGVTDAGYNSDFPSQFAQGVGRPVGLTLGLVSERIGGSELLNMQLTALQSKGNIRILSSPSITTLDNEPAIIKSGEERAYRETSGTGNDLDVSVEWKEAVLELNVIPHVVDGEILRIEIKAKKESFDDTKPQSSGEYPINKKEASTTVLLRNGETVVIGGLSLESDSDTRSGIPVLMDLPGVGALFRNRDQRRKFDETLIFITPRILAGSR